MMEQINQAIQILSGIQPTAAYKVGIGITTHNRHDILHTTMEQISKYAPSGAVIVLVDDASEKPVVGAAYRFAKNVGIAQAKNKCLELLYKAGCDYFFLFDDDCYPKKHGWELPYITSKEPHLNYIFKDFATGPKINDTIELYRDEEIIAYSHVRGCMIYCDRSVLDKVGGMDPVFGKWGWEHPSWSDRIFMAGMTSFRFMDVVGSSEYIHSMDEHRQVNTTVGGQDRKAMIAKNQELYQQRRFNSDYIPFFPKENILLTCYLTNVADTQNGRDKWVANKADLAPLIASLKNTRLIVLTDCFEPWIDGKVEYVKVSTSINPYFNRWILYRQYLMRNRHRYDKVFCIDATDIEVLHEPDWANIGDILYVGDEDEQVACKWLKDKHPNPVFADLFSRYGSHQLLNAGIIGGSVDSLIEFTRQLIDCYVFAKEAEHSQKKAAGDYTDMAMFNYILYTNFMGQFHHGRQVNTRFKGDERNSYSWFKHK